MKSPWWQRAPTARAATASPSHWSSSKKWHHHRHAQVPPPQKKREAKHQSSLFVHPKSGREIKLFPNSKAKKRSLVDNNQLVTFPGYKETAPHCHQLTALGRAGEGYPRGHWLKYHSTITQIWSNCSWEGLCVSWSWPVTPDPRCQV